MCVYEALETIKGPNWQMRRSFRCKISRHGEQDGNSRMLGMNMGIYKTKYESMSDRC